jgi:hypothetical protein
MQLATSYLVKEGGGGGTSIAPASWSLNATSPFTVEAIIIPTMWPPEGGYLPIVRAWTTPAEAVGMLREGMKAFQSAIYKTDLTVGSGPAWTPEDGRAMVPVATYLYGRQISVPWVPNSWELAWLLKQSPSFQAEMVRLFAGTQQGRQGIGTQWAIVAPPFSVSLTPYPGLSAGAAPGEDPKAHQQLADEQAPPVYLATRPGWRFIDPIPPYKTPVGVDVTGGSPPATTSKTAVWPWLLGAAGALGVLAWAVWPRGSVDRRG